MAIALQFSSDALLACRFAVSPLQETISAVRLLARRADGGHHGPWLRAVEPALDALDLTLLSLLLPRGTYGPDFLNPPPSGPTATFAEELETVRRTPAVRVGGEIDRCLTERFGAHPPPAAEVLRRGDRARGLCVDALAACWSALVDPWWPVIRAALDADIAYRSRLLAEAGLGPVLADLHPRLRWTHPRLIIDAPTEEEHLVEGIVLMPGAFTTLGVSYEPASVGYAARGLASLWTGPARPSAATAQLLGARRAELLAALDEPASTTGLAARCGLPVSSVSEHLAALHATGLVTRHRTGRSLQHTRTPLGSALLTAAQGTNRECVTSPATTLAAVRDADQSHEGTLATRQNFRQS